MKSVIHRDSAMPLAVTELAAHPTRWFLLDLNRLLKPFISQIVKRHEFVTLDSPHVFRHRQLLLRGGLYGQRWLRAVAACLVLDWRRHLIRRLRCRLRYGIKSLDFGARRKRIQE